MEFKGEHLQGKKKSFEEEEAMAASSSFFHLLSLLHHVVRGCAGYLGLSRLCDSLKDPKPDSTSAVPAAISQEEGDNNKVPVSALFFFFLNAKTRNSFLLCSCIRANMPCVFSPPQSSSFCVD